MAGPGRRPRGRARRRRGSSRRARRCTGRRAWPGARRPRGGEVVEVQELARAAPPPASAGRWRRPATGPSSSTRRAPAAVHGRSTAATRSRVVGRPRRQQQLGTGPLDGVGQLGARAQRCVLGEGQRVVGPGAVDERRRQGHHVADAGGGGRVEQERRWRRRGGDRGAGGPRAVTSPSAKARCTSGSAPWSSGRGVVGRTSTRWRSILASTTGTVADVEGHHPVTSGPPPAAPAPAARPARRRR